jgi:hypothetical protein
VKFAVTTSELATVPAADAVWVTVREPATGENQRTEHEVDQQHRPPDLPTESLEHVRF